MNNLEKYFAQFRENVIGINTNFTTKYGNHRIVYADWTASGRLYAPIEDKIKNEFGPFVANTHTETNITGTAMTKAYHRAKEIIKKHVNATSEDALIMAGAGMTAAVNKFQRILGIRIPEKFENQIQLSKNDRPLVIITHREHHSNHTSWIETIADLEIMVPDKDGKINLDYLQKLLKKYEERPVKIASVTDCSNVTGIRTPVHEIAKIMHAHGGLCFVDYACSAPYVKIDMHPADELERLDAIFFSPHKFLGGPGSAGVLIFDEKLYKNRRPDHPGGGTVLWTNAWKEHHYFEDIEIREDGGTPAFLQTIRAALAIQLKEKMGIDNILRREEEMLDLIFSRMKNVPKIKILEEKRIHRLGVVSFYMEDLHHNLVVKILNDRYGIQMRGGCACAGTYGHYLFYIDRKTSKSITDMIDHGDMTKKPGWVRFSINPIMTDAEIIYITDALKEIAANGKDWSQDYYYDEHANEYYLKENEVQPDAEIEKWFKL